MRRRVLLMSALFGLACGSGADTFPNLICVSPNLGVNPATGRCEQQPGCPPPWPSCPLPDAGTPR